MPTRLEQLQKLLALEPNDPFLLYSTALEHAKTGDHARAVEFFDRCLAADPAYCYAYFHKAVSLKAADRAGEARDTLTAGIRAAQAAGDAKAIGELSGMLESL